MALEAVDKTSSSTELYQLVNPYIDQSHLGSQVYKLNLGFLTALHKMIFNQHPTVLRAEPITNWSHFVANFVDTAFSMSDASISALVPSMDVLFSDIIHDQELRAVYDPSSIDITMKVCLLSHE